MLIDFDMKLFRVFADLVVLVDPVVYRIVDHPIPRSYCCTYPESEVASTVNILNFFPRDILR